MDKPEADRTEEENDWLDYVETKRLEKNEYNRKYKLGRPVSIEVTKPTKATKLGITLQPVNGRKSIVVGTIAKNSLFAGTALRQGMELVSINGSMHSTFDEGVALLKESEAV